MDPRILLPTAINSSKFSDFISSSDIVFFYIRKVSYANLSYIIGAYNYFFSLEKFDFFFSNANFLDPYSIFGPSSFDFWNISKCRLVSGNLIRRMEKPQESAETYANTAMFVAFRRNRIILWHVIFLSLFSLLSPLFGFDNKISWLCKMCINVYFT